MAKDLMPVCDTTRYAMQMLLPYRCKYCTQHFEIFSTYLNHKRTHELRYTRFWYGYLKKKKRLRRVRPGQLKNSGLKDDNLRYMYYDDSDGEIVVYQYREKKFVKLFNYKVFEEIPIAGRNLPCQYMFPPYKSKGMSVVARSEGVKHRRKGGVQRVVKQFAKKVGTKYICRICSKSFNKSYTWELHERSHSIKTAGSKVTKKLFCKICSKVFHQADILELHERSHAFKTPEKKSPKLGARCISRAAKILLDAVNDETVNGKHKCKHCSQSFSDLPEWELHERSHTFMNSKQKILTLKIRETAQAFEEAAKAEQEAKQTVQSNEVVELPNDIPLLKKCEPVQFSKKDLVPEDLSPKKVPTERIRLQKVTKQLQEQLKKKALTIPVPEQIPHQGQLLPCCYCNMKFKTVSELAQHDKTHAKKSPTKRPFQCGLCGKYFTQSGSLRAHERIHTGERPYVCKLCGKSFHESGKLKRHERTHTGEKPYACCWCGKRFTQNGTRKSHERTHRDMYVGAPPVMALGHGLQNSWAAELQTSLMVNQKK